MAKYLPFKKTVLLDGQQSLTVYSIGWLALLTRRHPGTMRSWERRGLLPLPLFEKQIDPMFRYYCAAELMGYARIINSARREVGKAYDKGLKERMHSFRADLKKAMAANPGNLVLKLPDEERLETSLKNNVDKHQRRIGKELSKMQ